MNQRTKVKKETLFYKIIKRVILFGVVLLMLFGYSLYDEKKRAELFCDSINGSYEFKILSTKSPHYCNQEPIYQFSHGRFGYSIRDKINLSWETLPIN